MIFVIASEVKIQAGEDDLDLRIPGTKTETGLRDNPAGGIVVWFKKGRSMTVWEGSLHQQELWMASERIWLKMESKKEKLAICGLYLRTEGPKNGDHHRSNELLLEKLKLEHALLETEGYNVGYLGDFNAHVGTHERFRFQDNPHDVNNNGKMVIAFAKEMNLYCMNPLKWGGTREDRVTFQKDLGVRYVKSILDLGLGTRAFFRNTVKFAVTDSEDWCVDSDHSALLIELSEVGQGQEEVARPYNALRSITKWDSFKKVLDRRLNNEEVERFKGLSVKEQGTSITEHLKAAGRQVIAPNVKGGRVKMSSKALRRLSKANRVARRELRSAVVQKVRGTALDRLRDKARVARLDHFKQEAEERFKRRTKLRQVIRKGGSAGAKLFWELIRGNKKKSSGAIDALEGADGLIFSPLGKKKVIEEFFQKKFRTKEEPVEVEEHDGKHIGQPERTLSDDQAESIVKRISTVELERAIADLKPDKAEGLDQLTNKMLKNATPTVKAMILMLFNNVLVAGINPDEWKVGEVILLLKRPMASNIENYRPITLISCLSKLLTKIVASRIAEALEDAGVIDDTQNGFRRDRCCADNIFSLNALLSLNRSKKRLASLMFVDLQEAYDRVDRGILLKKMKQLNFPSRLLAYLKDYYSGDCVVTDAAGARSTRQYQSRGLRQGCNLSSILFLIYVSELGSRLQRSGLGIERQGGSPVPFFMFADDIVLMAIHEADLKHLKNILESWASDFRMKISIKKTQVISPDSEEEWFLIDQESGEKVEIKTVPEYRYLGIDQGRDERETSMNKSRSMVAKAESYKASLFRLRQTVPDQVDSFRAIWESVAMPSILYGVEALIVSQSTIEALDRIQAQVAKALIGVGVSSANVVAEVELGFKPFHLRIATATVKFIVKHFQSSDGCKLTKELLKECLDEPSNTYRKYLDRLLLPVGESAVTVGQATLQKLEDFHKKRVTELVGSMATTRLMSLPTIWWKKQRHVEEGAWSRMLSRFRVMNVGLGNRDTYYREYAVFVDQGRVVVCPLCSKGPNNEIHLVMECRVLKSERSKIKIDSDVSLGMEIAKIKDDDPEGDKESWLRQLVGQDKTVSRLRMIQRGIALSCLVDRFFSLWSELIGATVQRRPDLPQAIVQRRPAWH